MIRRPPRSTQSRSSAASDVYKRQIAVLHTLLDQPLPHQKQVLEAVMRRADVSVVMSQAGLDRIRDIYDADASRIVLAPHGVTPLTGPREPNADAPIVLTWGIIA